MLTNEIPVQSPYDQLVTIHGDLQILEAVLENVNSIPDNARNELEHFVHRLNDRFWKVLEELCPPPGEA